MFSRFLSSSCSVNWKCVRRMYCTPRMDYFKSILGEKDVITEKDTVQSFNQDWLKQYKGSGSLVLQPRTAEDVSKVLSYCNDEK